MSADVSHLEGTECQRKPAPSPAVVTEGGKVVRLAGQTTTVDEDGNDLAGRFEDQAKTRPNASRPSIGQ